MEQRGGKGGERERKERAGKEEVKHGGKKSERKRKGEGVD